MNFTRLRNAIVVCLLCVSFATSQSTNENRPRLTNKEVLELVKAEVSAEVIVAKIKVSRCNFDTDPTVLSELKRNGVSNEVLKAMIEAPYGSPKVEKLAEKVTVTESIPKSEPEVVEARAKTDRWHV